MQRVRTVLSIVGVATILLLSVTSQPAGAFGERNLNEPWGCKAWIESWALSGGRGQINTIQLSAGSCSSMYVAARFSGGVTGAFYYAVGNIHLTASTSAGRTVVGGRHKTCGGCATRDT